MNLAAEVCFVSHGNRVVVACLGGHSSFSDQLVSLLHQLSEDGYIYLHLLLNLTGICLMLLQFDMIRFSKKKHKSQTNSLSGSWIPKDMTRSLCKNKTNTPGFPMSSRTGWQVLAGRKWSFLY